MAAIQTAISKAEKIGLDSGNLRRLESAGGIRAIRDIRRLETKGTYNQSRNGIDKIRKGQKMTDKEFQAATVAICAILLIVLYTITALYTVFREVWK